GSNCPGSGFHQKLQIRHGDCDPVTVLAFPEPWAVPSDACALIGSVRYGFTTSPIVGAFQRMGVSPNGRHVVFEVTDDFGEISKNLVPPGQEEGIFVVRADGRGLRRLGPASRDPSFRYVYDPASPFVGRASAFVAFDFSPDGGTLVLTDLGQGRGGEEATQIFTLDIKTGSRSQLTHLPLVADRAVGTSGLVEGTCCPFFLDDGRIGFFSSANADGSNPEGSQGEFVMNRDGSGLERVPLPVAIPGSQVVPIFGITGARRSAITVSVPCTPVNSPEPVAGPFNPGITEIFFLDGRGNLVQLTTFRRADTSYPRLTRDGQRVIFVASADPFGTNPSATCHLFSITTLPTAFPHLTHFSQPEYSVSGCS